MSTKSFSLSVLPTNAKRGLAICLIVIASSLAGRAVIPSGTGAKPELPRVILDTTQVVATGRTLAVRSSDQFHTALKDARPGDVISLQAGSSFIGNFTLPAKSGQGWIVIRTSASDRALPPAGSRIGPQHSGVLARIITPNAEAAILTAPAAHHYRLVGLEITVAEGVGTNYGIVKLGSASKDQATLSAVPQDLIIDRCYIHGNPKGNVSRGIALNSGRTAVIDSFISECHGVGFDTQAICGWNGPGPFKIVNNYLEGAGENFMLGGADPGIPDLTPSDIEFRRNLVRKPLRWKKDDPSYAGIHWSVKNLFELKNARRVIVDGNMFEYNWVDAQNGFAVLLTPRNDEGSAPWSLVQDITFKNNIVRHTAGGINIHGKDDIHPSDQAKRIEIRNNLFVDIGWSGWGRNGIFLQLTAAVDVTVDHNTVIQSGNLLTTYGEPTSGLTFVNNIGRHNEYGVFGDSVGVGMPALAKYLPGAIFTRNVFIGGEARNYPSGNVCVRSAEEVGFVDVAKGNFRLSRSSGYKNGGLDRKDLGCDLEMLERETANLLD